MSGSSISAAVHPLGCESPGKSMYFQPTRFLLPPYSGAPYMPSAACWKTSDTKPAVRSGRPMTMSCSGGSRETKSGAGGNVCEAAVSRSVTPVTYCDWSPTYWPPAATSAHARSGICFPCLSRVPSRRVRHDSTATAERGDVRAKSSG